MRSVSARSVSEALASGAAGACAHALGTPSDPARAATTRARERVGQYRKTSRNQCRFARRAGPTIIPAWTLGADQIPYRRAPVFPRILRFVRLLTPPHARKVSTARGEAESCRGA